MSLSRLTGIIAAIGAALSAGAGSLQIISPKWGGTLAAIGAVITLFCERVTGGLSDPEKRVQAAIAERRDEAARE